MLSDPLQDAYHALVAEEPPLPGLVLRYEVLDRFRISQADLARLTGVSPARINQVLNGRNSISAELALRLGTVTTTDPAYWIGVQMRFNLHQKSQKLKQTLDRLVVLTPNADGF